MKKSILFIGGAFVAGVFVMILFLKLWIVNLPDEGFHEHANFALFFEWRTF